MRKLISAFPAGGNGRDNFLPNLHAIQRHDQINSSPIQVVDTALDFATIPVIGALLLLSLVSLSFIFHLRLRSRQLREFNNLWTVRLLLVFFISHWAINEIVRLPLFRRRYLFPFMPSLTLSQQDDICKLHVVFSLGFMEPGFLLSLFFLISESVKKQNRSETRAFCWVMFMSLPTLILQTVVVFLNPLEAQLPWMMVRSSFVSVDDGGNKSMTCTYPLLSSLVFGAFGGVYSVGLLISCWRVVSLVINKKMKLRMKVLGLTVMVSLLVESLLLGVVGIAGKPESMWYGAVLLGMFVSVAICGGVAEIVLVIKPIGEALKCEWNPVLQQPVEDQDQKQNIYR